MTGPFVVGLDLSLTSTGIADEVHADVVRTVTLAPGKRRGPARLAWLRDQIAPIVHGSDLVAVEGYAYGRQNGGEKLGELGGVIRLLLWETGTRYIEVPPSTLKMYATGKGNAGKVDVIVAARDRLGYDGTDDNQADALWLRALGFDVLGQPLVDLPKTHRRALDKLELPDDLRRAA